jgi:hypothetical protein
MADYLPLLIDDITETKLDNGEIRMTARCRTVQPELINLNVSKLDSARLQKFNTSKGKILMVPIRRGEMNGRPFVSIQDGHIFHDPDVQANFELTDKPQSEKPSLFSTNKDKTQAA